MNTTFIQQIQNGFRRDETLASRITFRAFIWINDKWMVEKPLPDGEKRRTWILKDEFGAKFGVWSEKLAESLVIGEKYVVRGDVKIGKGGTFMNITKASWMHGADYQPSDDSSF